MAGKLDVIYGGMFSGKTEELVRKLRRALIARKNVVAFKYGKDTRYETDKLCSHNGVMLDCIPVLTTHTIDQFMCRSSTPDVLAIDEAQFFGDEIVPFVQTTVEHFDIHVIVAGLDLDYMGRPFGHMGKLSALADTVTKLHAICVQCGEPASRSFRVSNEDGMVVIGGADKYKALCLSCFVQESSNVQMSLLDP